MDFCTYLVLVIHALFDSLKWLVSQACQWSCRNIYCRARTSLLLLYLIVMFNDRWLTLGIGNHVKLKRCRAAVDLKGLSLRDLLKGKIAVTWEDRNFKCSSVSVSLTEYCWHYIHSLSWECQIENRFQHQSFNFCKVPLWETLHLRSQKCFCIILMASCYCCR